MPAKAFKTGVDVLRTFESFSSSVWADESDGKKPKALKNKKAFEKSSASGEQNKEWTEEQEKWNEKEQEEEWKDDGNWEEQEEEWKDGGNWDEEEVDMNAVYENEDNFEAERRVLRPEVVSSRQNNRIVEQFMPRYHFLLIFFLSRNRNRNKSLRFHNTVY